jgi:hypothetical protein
VDWLISLGLGVTVVLVLVAWLAFDWVGAKIADPVDGVLVLFVSRCVRAPRRRPSKSLPSDLPPPPPSP